jgi:hypothetical protein
VKKAEKPRWLQRVIFAFLGLLVMLTGAGIMLQTGTGDRDWWVKIRFAPILIVIGAVAVIGAFRTATTQKTKKKSRIRGWPTGRAKYRRSRSGLS